MTQSPPDPKRRPLLSPRKTVHMSMLGFAFLLPFLTWQQAAGAAILALVFNLVILPRLQVDLSKRPVLARAPLPEPATAPGAMPPASASTAPIQKPSSANPEPSLWTGIIIYPISVLLLILFYRHQLYVVGAVWAIMALGDGCASVVGEALGGPRLPYNRQKTWSGFAGFIVAGTAGAYLLARWIGPIPDPSLPAQPVTSSLITLIICAATAVVGALVESVPARLDDNLTVPLVAGAFMYCAYLMERSALASNLPYLGRRVVLALAVNLILAALAWGLKMVDRSGALVGFLLGVAIYMGYGWKSFLMLVAFFALGSLATRLGYAKKAARGIAERRGGARSWREALANSLAGAFFAVLVITTRHEAAFLLALIAAFAEAAGDTVSSEVGQWLSPRAYLITNFRPVPAGANGGVSLAGSAAGLAASALVVALAYTVGLTGPAGALVALAAALAGNIFDSMLGATFERRGLVTNGLVNFAGTSFAGALALSVALHWGM
jgi:uncharacterized protein (TIGR00297 family)